MRNARFVTALVGAGALAACGGGGGGGGGTGVTVPPPVPTNLSETSVQRNDAQSALSGVQAYQEYAGGGSISTLTAVRVVHTMLAKTNPKTLLTAPPRHVLSCNTSPGVNEYTSGDTITIEDYYDSQCTQLEAEIVWTVTQSGNTYTGPAVFTEYSMTGGVTESANVQITFIFNSADTAVTGFSFLLSNVVDNGTAISGEIGLACNAGTATTCDIAVVANVAALSAEDGSSVSATATTSSISMQISDYQGAENSLSIAQGTFPAWVISPSADLVASVSIAGQATSSGFSLSLTDSTNGGTFAITGTSSGVTGTLTNNATGATVASFTVDDQGNGTLTYSNNSQVSIVDYIVQG
ncbi:MAG TPA: hypothetical protein VMV65_07745 [Alphaproteobacteria bacterium]|nr:hypothetical protein [Alphaproteobacteria bacterium]